MIEEPLNLEQLRKPARKPLRAGDIFAYRLKGLDYGFGRVICTKTAYGRDSYVLYFYRAFSADKHAIPKLSRSALLLPPTITRRWLWSAGRFENVAYAPLKPEDVHAVHCFKCRLSGTYVDEFGKPLAKRFRPTGDYVCSLDGVIDDLLSEARGIPTLPRLDPLTHARLYEAERRAAARKGGAAGEGARPHRRRDAAG